MVEPDAWAADRPPEEPALRFATLPEFVAHLCFIYRREVADTNSRAWCPSWWLHPEAVIRMEAMWRTLEALRLDPSMGISTWLIHHVDPHMDRLLDPAGPFRGCSVRRGHSPDPLGPLPTVPPPDGWWEAADSGL